MLSCRSIIIITSVLWLLDDSTDSFSTNVVTRQQSQQTPTSSCTRIWRNSHHIRHDDYSCDQYVPNHQEDRRNFLKHFSAIAGSILLSPAVFSPSLVFADEDDSKETGEDNKATVDKVETIIKEEVYADEDNNKKTEDDRKATMDKVETIAKEEAGANEDNNKKVEDDDKLTIEKVETIIKDEKELDAEVLQEEADQKKSIDDEKKLINEIEQEMKMIESATPEELEKEEENIKRDTEALIKEEEKIKTETEEIITKIESMESEVASLDDKGKVGDDEKNKESVSEEFVDKLKQQVVEKEDLITRLKRQSEKDIDPKTGKFKTMSQKDYKERVKSTDADFMKFLKDTVGNEQEWQRDFEAFEGFLDEQFGPALKELSKDLKPFEKALEDEVKNDVAPVLEDKVQQLRDKARLAGVDTEAEEIKRRAGDLIRQLRSVF